MKTVKKSLVVLIAVVMAMSLAVPAFAMTDTEQKDADTESAALMLDTVKSPQVGSIGGEWAVIGLARSGYTVPQEYWDAYYATVEKYAESCKGVLHTKKYTEYSRVNV